VQFLGSKLRVIDEVREACIRGIHQSNRVWDAFSGSSVVAQSVAGASYPVLATDALAASVVFARALLGVDRIPGRDPIELAPLVLARADDLVFGTEWEETLEIERRAIGSGDAETLATLSQSLPQRWRRAGATGAQQRLFDDTDTASKAGVALSRGLLSTTYAGTYFGVTQAVRLEAIRAAVDSLERECLLDRWEAAVVLTALSFAASRAVYSAGKHFAQPLRISSTGFHGQRLLSDRAVDIDEVFEIGVANIAGSARPIGEHHLAELAEAQKVDGGRLSAMGVGTVYADPPYTAQQYSRFYHLLDVLVDGTPAALQVRAEQVTSGLYPAERYSSPFCSRTRAAGAFSALSRNARDANARLVISYSVSARKSTGNARSIGLEQLLEVIRAEYGHRNVVVQELDLRYRQFNSSGLSSPTRDDMEVLIVGEPA